MISHNTNDVPVNVYRDTDENGNPRVIAVVPELPRPSAPLARHVRRTLEAL